MNKKYAICYNLDMKNSKKVMNELKSILSENNIEADELNIDSLKSGYDFIFVIGGDGTILKAARYFSKFNTPIFGINLGRLGFLSQANQSELSLAVEKILNGDYKTEKRIMLCANNYTALNDFVIKGSQSSRVTKFSLEINGKFVSEYMADGIIISTPTGSTAYAMASGGPIINPDIDVLAIVPICPHTFSARPIVVSANDEIKILSHPNGNYKVSADGQEVFSFTDDLIITKSQHCANLALLNDNDFYEVLRNKLHWGISPACNNFL